MRNYRSGNYSLVIGNSFKPFTLQEILTPMQIYKDAYEQTEAAYDDLNQKADTFSYLADVAEQNPDSKAAKIYKGYADELHKQADDLAKHGLSMGNRRALTSLKRRYQGEIGRLMKADAAMDEERKLRRANKDTSMLYAQDNLNIDDFLDGETPNLYSVSGEDLRKEAAQYAQSASSRIYGDTRIQDINKYFQDIIQTQGYSPEAMAAWRQNLESIPEFSQAVEDIMAARGVNGNLTGANYERARQNIINGIMEGSIYQEKRTSHQNPGVLTAAQANSAYLQKRGQDLSAMGNNMRWNSQTGRWEFDEEIAKKRAEIMGVDPNVNYDNWEKGPDGKWHKKTKSATPKTGKHDLLENESYDTKLGTSGPVASGKSWGTPITKEEAMELAPDLVAACGEYTKHYKFYKSGNSVVRRRVTSSVPEDDIDTAEVPPSVSNTGNGSNHNAL